MFFIITKFNKLRKFMKFLKILTFFKKYDNIYLYEGAVFQSTRLIEDAETSIASTSMKFVVLALVAQTGADAGS